MFKTGISGFSRKSIQQRFVFIDNSTIPVIWLQKFKKIDLRNFLENKKISLENFLENIISLSMFLINLY